MSEQNNNRGPSIDRVFSDLAKAQGEVVSLLGTKYEEVELPAAIVQLAMVRVSQLNGCASCLSVHARSAREAGVSQDRLDILPAWREVDTFDEREKAALELAEHLTVLPQGQRHADAALRAGEHFNDEQLAALEWAIVMINTYNRISIASGHGPVAKK